MIVWQRAEYVKKSETKIYNVEYRLASAIHEVLLTNLQMRLAIWNIDLFGSSSELWPY